MTKSTAATPKIVQALLDLSPSHVSNFTFFYFLPHYPFAHYH